MDWSYDQVKDITIASTRNNFPLRYKLSGVAGVNDTDAMDFQAGPISLARQLFLIGVVLTPLVYSMMVGLVGKGKIRDKLKHIALSSIAVYVWLALVFVLYIFIVPVFWNLEGILPEVILVFFVDPKGPFSKVLDVSMSGLAIAGAVYLPFYLRRKVVKV